MKLFRKVYTIDYALTELDFENLGFDSVDELCGEVFDAYKIDSLVYFNQVVAKFENASLENKILVKFEIPKRSRYLLLICVILSFVCIVGATFTEDFESNLYFRCLIYCLPVIIFAGLLIYQFEFLKGSRNFIKKVTISDNSAKEM